jgi:hypothetical protein
MEVEIMVLRKIKRLLALASLFLLGSVGAAVAQDNRPLLVKPAQRFFFFQLNFIGGYDSREPGSGWGPSDRGPLNQVAFELFGKSERTIQRGFIGTLAPAAWGVKVAFEFNPAEQAGGDPTLDLRILDTFVRFDTKWDRTSVTFGHRNIPFGQNPRLDTELTFAPSQASTDLGFSRDTGVFLTTPLADRLDLEVALTAGGTLSSPIVAIRNDPDGSGLELDDQIASRGSYLLTGRISRPKLFPTDGGFFLALGKLHRASGELTEISRLGADLVFKSREDWVLITQLSIGENHDRVRGDRQVANLLNSFEWFISSQWRLGLTNVYRFENPDAPGAENRENGTLFGSIGWALSRDARIRLNPFLEWRDNTASRESGILVQLCVGCGLRK